MYVIETETKGIRTQIKIKTKKNDALNWCSLMQFFKFIVRASIISIHKNKTSVAWYETIVYFRKFPFNLARKNIFVIFGKTVPVYRISLWKGHIKSISEQL
jgi:hypothetical protein